VIKYSLLFVSFFFFFDAVTRIIHGIVERAPVAAEYVVVDVLFTFVLMALASELEKHKDA